MMLHITLIIIFIILFCGICFLMKSFFQFIRLKKQLFSTRKTLEVELEKNKNFSGELEKIKDEMTRNLLIDALTALPSRQVFEDRLTQTLHQSQRYQLTFSVLLLDLNKLSVINATFGYESGNTILKEIAERIKNAIRHVDTVTRLTQDEFAILLPQISKPEASAYVAQRLLDKLSDPFMVQEEELFLTASIGIAVYPTDADNVVTLLKNADNALYQAKIAGSHRYQFYHQEMYEVSRRELILSSSLRSASIFNDFSIYYQPQLDTQTNKIVCMEALLRWQHPQFGVITPKEFLRLAENSRKIIEIGQWVLRNVCRQFQHWHATGFNIPQISVNISFTQLENVHFVHHLSQLLYEINFNPKDLILEITEGTLVTQSDLVAKSLRMLKHLGVQIAIDHFGTGNMSLQSLHSFPIDYLKMDASLVQDIETKKESEALVNMILALANTLKCKVIAEGVETEMQKNKLQAWGCYWMQGYLFGMPTKPDELTEWEKFIS